MRPGVNVALIETAPSRTLPTDTGVWFVVGMSDRGPVDRAVQITSMAGYERYYGPKVSYGYLYDALDVFFREGGGVAQVARVVGPSPVTATVSLSDTTPAPTLKVEASSPGEWGNALNVQVVAGSAAGEFVLVITHDTEGELERSPSLATKADAIAWGTNHQYVKISDLAGTGDPAVVAATGLSGGLDNRATATDVHWANALALFNKDLGPGQVSMPGRTDTVSYGAVMDHAGTNNRAALLDAPNTNSKSTLLTTVQGLQGGDGRWAAMFGPWLTCPGTVGGTRRTIPPSAAVAGLIARSDALSGSANVPAAGENGQTVYCNELATAAFTDLDREELNANGYNAIILKYGGVRVYGWRSLADPGAQPNWINWGNSRLITEIVANADAVSEGFLFDQIDGQGTVISNFGNALVGMLTPYWTAGSLYGMTPNEAFSVNVGPQVNTPETLADLELRAVIGVRCSPFAEMITIELVKTPITENLL